MIRPAFLLLAATALAAPAAAQTTQFSPQRLRQHVQTLGSDAYEGRGVATPAETRTVNYLISQFKAAGVQPGGAVVNGKRTWTQPVPLLKSDWVSQPAVTLTTRAGSTRLVQGTDIAVRSPENGSTTLNLANTPIVFAGYGVAAPERNWDDFKGQDVRGKVIVVLVNDPDFEGGDGQFGGKAMTYYGRWTYKYEEAAKRGAAGVMIVHETAPASYGWNTVKNSNTNTMFDIVRQNPAAAHTPFETWITLDTARKLFAASGQNFDTLKAAARRADFRPVDLGATVSATGTAKTQVITSQNVVGVLPGRTRPDETVIYSAHWDHLGIGLPDANGDRIYNGALDNATGISHILEQARAFGRGPRPERSIVFLAVTAEEKGLLGSEYYARNPLYPVAKTVGVLNTDSMGVFGRARDFSISGTARLDLLDLLVAEGQREGRTFKPDPHPETGGFYRSDHFSFAKVGVPAVSFEAGLDLENGGVARGEQISREYVDKRYHQPDDEYSPSWDFSGMAADATLLHAVGLQLANGNQWPNWSADSEFRAARDASAAERGGAAPTAAPVPAPAPAATPGERG
ncbi:M28 family metallopeptidase [Sphingomonas sp. BN140010]|uniref:M28 family metallopeptidase n=1 Tax=Sphingomonas arvum TaxID=2992113 RepID=A0ABT3JCZ2_9SPHN|nr:M28 family metallopeptidase [Sphingomonas sp. BN140010]MCW3796942.1 M28 family metallopeptidase [Sphingomonas sp. BN140010]